MSAPLHGSGPGGPPSGEGRRLPHLRRSRRGAVPPKGKPLSLADLAELLQRPALLIGGVGSAYATFKGVGAMEKGDTAVGTAVAAPEKRTDAIVRGMKGMDASFVMANIATGGVIGAIWRGTDSIERATDALERATDAIDNWGCVGTPSPSPVHLLFVPPSSIALSYASIAYLRLIALLLR